MVGFSELSNRLKHQQQQTKQQQNRLNVRKLNQAEYLSMSFLELLLLAFNSEFLQNSENIFSKNTILISNKCFSTLNCEPCVLCSIPFLQSCDNSLCPDEHCEQLSKLSGVLRIWHLWGNTIFRSRHSMKIKVMTSIIINIYIVPKEVPPITINEVYQLFRLLLKQVHTF